MDNVTVTPHLGYVTRETLTLSDLADAESGNDRKTAPSPRPKRKIGRSTALSRTSMVHCDIRYAWNAPTNNPTHTSGRISNCGVTIDLPPAGRPPPQVHAAQLRAQRSMRRSANVLEEQRIEKVDRPQRQTLE